MQSEPLLPEPDVTSRDSGETLVATCTCTKLCSKSTPKRKNKRALLSTLPARQGSYQYSPRNTLTALMIEQLTTADMDIASLSNNFSADILTLSIPSFAIWQFPSALMCDVGTHPFCKMTFEEFVAHLHVLHK